MRKGNKTGVGRGEGESTLAHTVRKGLTKEEMFELKLKAFTLKSEEQGKVCSTWSKQQVQRPCGGNGKETGVAGL